MASATIGSLRVLLGLDTASFEVGLAAASKKFTAFGNVLKSGAVIATAAVAGAAAGLGVAIKNTVDQADELSKASQKIGIPVEQLSALSHAADLSGVSCNATSKLSFMIK